MMRNGDIYGLAVRQATGEIYAGRLPWVSLTEKSWLRAPFIRGFPVLLETMVNGIQALNRSVAIYEREEEVKSNPLHVGFSVALAVIMAVALFVVAPHILSLLMLPLALGGDVEGLAFHLWDGFYKCVVFIGYIWIISFIPDIRRVFEYHGAEHKTIHAWESGGGVNSCHAAGMSRLHPRCGTTFLLFVICISIILQALVLPLMLKAWTPHGMIAKHVLSLFYKLLLVAPISACAYELIRFAARLPNGILATSLQAPGLVLQKLTTREPAVAQLEVAVVALAEALGPEENGDIRTVPYLRFTPDAVDTVL